MVNYAVVKNIVMLKKTPHKTCQQPVCIKAKAPDVSVEITALWNSSA